MTSHLGILILFAVCVAAVFATLLRDDPREQVRFGGRLLAMLVGGALVLGWVEYLVFG